MNSEPPRLAHNRAIAAAYIASAGNPPRYPKVSEQVECLPLEIGKLKPFAYNPTIIEHEGKILMAHRFHDGGVPTKLEQAELDETGKVISTSVLDIKGNSIEDPRFFKHEGQPWLSWVDSTWPAMPPTSVVKYQLVGFGEPVQPVFGHNDWTGLEKNWVPFEYDGALVIIYQCCPTHRVSGLETVWETSGPRWPYGEIRGGTPPVEYEGNWLRFFHSHLQNELNPPHHRYYVGAYLMEPAPPFKVVRVSRKPVLYGSEADNLTPYERKGCPHWKPNVVFPGGIVTKPDGWLLSVGVNDSACAIVKIKPENLSL